MNKPPLIVVLGHGKARDISMTMLPWWIRHGAVMAIMSPEDDPLYIAGYPQLTLGKSSHHGPGNIARLRAAVEFLWAGRHSHDGLWIFEADSVCFQRTLPIILSMEVAGTWFYDPDNVEFKGKQFSHFPIGIGSGAIEYLHQEMTALGDNEESGYPDRYLGLAVANCPAIQRRQLDSYSQNTIETRHHQDMIDAIKVHNCPFVHGIKDAKTMSLAVDAYTDLLKAEDK